MNRTNNIFELVTVQPVLSNRPTDRHVILSDESYFSPEENKLRLKGINHKLCTNKYIFENIIIYLLKNIIGITKISMNNKKL